ncbi:hypothetical protein D3C72_1785530 [compost metagenome]
MHDQVARDFQQGIAEEEQTRAQAVGRGGDVQVDSDVGLGECNVGAIEKADHIRQHQQGHELAEQQPGQRAVCRRGQRWRAGGGYGLHERGLRWADTALRLAGRAAAVLPG